MVRDGLDDDDYDDDGDGDDDGDNDDDDNDDKEALSPLQVSQATPRAVEKYC